MADEDKKVEEAGTKKSKIQAEVLQRKADFETFVKQKRADSNYQ